jgi:hypothetical protein
MIAARARPGPADDRGPGPADDGISGAGHDEVAGQSAGDRSRSLAAPSSSVWSSVDELAATLGREHALVEYAQLLDGQRVVVFGRPGTHNIGDHLVAHAQSLKAAGCDQVLVVADKGSIDDALAESLRQLADAGNRIVEIAPADDTDTEARERRLAERITEILDADPGTKVAVVLAEAAIHPRALDAAGTRRDVASMTARLTAADVPLATVLFRGGENLVDPDILESAAQAGLAGTAFAFDLRAHPGRHDEFDLLLHLPQTRAAEFTTYLVTGTLTDEDRAGLEAVVAGLVEDSAPSGNRPSIRIVYEPGAAQPYLVQVPTVDQRVDGPRAQLESLLDRHPGLDLRMLCYPAFNELGQQLGLLLIAVRQALNLLEWQPEQCLALLERLPRWWSVTAGSVLDTAERASSPREMPPGPELRSTRSNARSPPCATGWLPDLRRRAGLGVEGRMVGRRSLGPPGGDRRARRDPRIPRDR